MKLFEDVGVVVWSCTKLEDVPAADTFSVDDVLVVVLVIIIIIIIVVVVVVIIVVFVVMVCLVNFV